MGTPFAGPIFLQSGVPRPQRALFFRGNERFQAGNISFVHGNATSQSEFGQDIEIQGTAAKLKGAHIFF